MESSDLDKFVSPLRDDPEEPPNSGTRMAHYLDRRVSDLLTVKRRQLSPGMQERHRLYALLLMSMTLRFWNGNRYGAVGDYGDWRAKQLLGPNLYRGAGFLDGRPVDYPGDYLGHNIASLAVDRLGEVIDFEFNHNEAFASSAEHAEARLVRRVFTLSQIFDNWETKSPGELEASTYSNILEHVTIYTTLEPCAQCAGIMALGSVKEVVYLQRDPGVGNIANALYNLTHRDPNPDPAAKEDPNVQPPLKPAAPMPIPGDRFGFEYYARLNKAYREFQAALARRADGTQATFFAPIGGSLPNSKKTSSDSLSSFLCTDTALETFQDAFAEFQSLRPKPPTERDPSVPVEELTSLRYPRFYPEEAGRAAATNPERNASPKVLSNAQVLDHVSLFFSYVSAWGKRATPHKS